MPISFNAFGDIVAVLELAWRFRAALHRASGASSEILGLIGDVDAFTRALEQVRTAIDGHNVTLAPAVSNGITCAILACSDVLRRVLGRADAFERRMTGALGARAWREYWAVAAWSILGGRTQVDMLRSRLSEQMSLIQTYLSLAHASDLSALLAVSERQGATLQRMSAAVSDIQARFDVGVPSFRFFERRTGRYYMPSARTSFSRLCDLLEHMTSRPAPFWIDERTGCICGDWSEMTVQQGPGITFAEFWAYFDTQCIAYPLSLCFFREQAFDQWQVLVGLGSMLDPAAEIVKLILERRHAIHARCICPDGGCSRRRRAVRRALAPDQSLYMAIRLTSQMSLLYAEFDVGPSSGLFHRDEFTGIRDELFEEPGPDRAYLASSVIPLLRLYIECRRPSIATIVRLLRSAPRETSRAGGTLVDRDTTYNAWSRPAQLKQLRLAHPMFPGFALQGLL